MKKISAVRFELIIFLGVCLMGKFSELKAEEIFHKNILVNGVAYAATFSREQFEQTLEVGDKTVHNSGSVLRLSLTKNSEGKPPGDTKPVWSQFVIERDPTSKKIIGDVAGHPRQQSLVLVYSDHGSNAIQIEEISPDSIPKEIPKLIRGSSIEPMKLARSPDVLHSDQLNSLLHSSVLGIDKISILIPNLSPEIRIYDLEGRNLTISIGSNGRWELSPTYEKH